MANRNVSAPIAALKEGEGHMVTVEMQNGEIYRGLLDMSEDSMNCGLSEVTHTARDGRISRLELVYLRGSHIKLIVLPEIVRDAPIFEKLKIQNERMLKKRKKKQKEQKDAQKRK